MTALVGGGICLVEDDPILGHALQRFFQLDALPCDWVRGISAARKALAQTNYCALISDIRLPDGDGAAFFRACKDRGESLPPTLFITGYGTVPEAVALLQAGASDYITKPFEPDELLVKLRRACPHLFTPDTSASAQRLGGSAAMRRIEQLLRRVARHRVPVLITGESGVGKEHAARFLHQQRAADAAVPFIAVNCAAVPGELFEAELFGAERGAFTGAVTSRRGLFEQAGSGTLFLDEVGELPLPLQAKLLRVVQERNFRRLGGSDELSCAAQLVWATNRDLEQAVAAGHFREDLYYRISTVRVELPPLRDRPEDIPWFAARFLADFAREYDRAVRLSPKAEHWLAGRPWPGNVRGLKQAIERAAIFSETGILEPEHFRAPEQLPLGPEADPASMGLRDYLADCERWYIERALERSHGRVGDTASLLGISRKGLWERMQRRGIRRDDCLSPVAPSGLLQAK